MSKGTKEQFNCRSWNFSLRYFNQRTEINWFLEHRHSKVILSFCESTAKKGSCKKTSGHPSLSPALVINPHWISKHPPSFQISQKSFHLGVLGFRFTALFQLLYLSSSAGMRRTFPFSLVLHPTPWSLANSTLTLCGWYGAGLSVR